MADSRYNRLDNQAPAQTQLKSQAPNVGRSAFDFSCNHVGTALIGALTPFDCFDVVPNEDIDLSLMAYFEFRNPTTRQLFNGFRVFFHYYYNRLTDLWEGAQNWLDKGRSGKVDLTRPNLIFKASIPASNGTTITANACSPLSLLNYLGLPAEEVQNMYAKTSTNTKGLPPLMWFQSAITNLSSDSISFTSDTVNNHVSYYPADCCMAYQRNWRDYYSNKNLLQVNKYWFPDNEHHFILSYDCESACAICYENEDLSQSMYDDDPTSQVGRQYANIVGTNSGYSYYDEHDIFHPITHEPNNPSTDINSVSSPESKAIIVPNLSGLKFRQFRGDRFTTSLPFPDLIRGDIPVLDSTNEFLRTSVGGPQSNTSLIPLVTTGTYPADESPTTFTLYNISSQSVDVNGQNRSLVVPNPLSSITMSDIYTLETLTAFKRRMGMTNGDYNEMIKAQYGVDPNVHDGKGTYIGGFYQDFSISSVTQLSESSNTPLGTRAGFGQSSGQGSIGHFHTPDFGWIQGYFSIVPDVFYTQGKPRMFSKKSNLEMYFPIFNNLPAQNIRNDELCVSLNSEATDSAPFGYEDRYAEYKSRPNRVSGLIALPHAVAEYDASRIIARRFSQLPNLNSTFVTMIPENIDMSVFSVTDEPPFDFAIGINCRRVFPGPYTAIEGSLSSPTIN